MTLYIDVDHLGGPILWPHERVRDLEDPENERFWTKMTI